MVIFHPRRIVTHVCLLCLKKRSRGLLALGAKKSKSEPNQLLFNYFDSFSTPFWIFPPLGPRGAGNSFRESPRQTKPKKGQFMNFSQGHSGTSFFNFGPATGPKCPVPGEKIRNSKGNTLSEYSSEWPLSTVTGAL